MAIGARPVGDSLYRQLELITDNLTGHLIEGCGHIIPLTAPTPSLPSSFLSLIAPSPTRRAQRRGKMSVAGVGAHRRESRPAVQVTNRPLAAACH